MARQRRQDNTYTGSILFTALFKVACCVLIVFGIPVAIIGFVLVFMHEDIGEGSLVSGIVLITADVFLALAVAGIIIVDHITTGFQRGQITPVAGAGPIASISVLPTSSVYRAPPARVFECNHKCAAWADPKLPEICPPSYSGGVEWDPTDPDSHRVRTSVFPTNTEVVLIPQNHNGPMMVLPDLDPTPTHYR